MKGPSHRHLIRFTLGWGESWAIAVTKAISYKARKMTSLQEAKLLAGSFDGVESIETVSCEYSFSLYVIRNCFFQRFGKAGHQVTCLNKRLPY
jgi:hypothetical protein